MHRTVPNLWFRPEPSEFINNTTTTTVKKNRIDQIATVRDYQRELLRTKYGNIYSLRGCVVILVDLDLYSLPSIDTLLQELHSMQTNESEFDVVCAAGIMYRPFGYYDIFATVLLDGTFVYPIRGRLEQELQDGEDYSLVRSNDVYGNFTQWDLLEYFERKVKTGWKCRAGTILFWWTHTLSSKCLVSRIVSIYRQPCQQQHDYSFAESLRQKYPNDLVNMSYFTSVCCKQTRIMMKFVLEYNLV